MSALEDTLARISRDFAYQIVNALTALPFEALQEELQFEPPARRKTASKREAPRAAAPEPRGELETALLEHLNVAGPTGSTVRAFVISTEGELPQDEHDVFERAANAVLAALEAKGLIQKRAYSVSRGQVYALAPVAV